MIEDDAADITAPIPTVTVGRYSGPGEEKIRGVLDARHAQLQIEVLDHLHRRSRKRPALIAVDDVFASSWAMDTRQTYIDWCSAHRITPIIKEVSAVVMPADLSATVLGAVGTAGADALICGGQGLAALFDILQDDPDPQLIRWFDQAGIRFSNARGEIPPGG